jgi:acetyltransferase-like isoleucine patch superfamily enzyme
MSGLRARLRRWIAVRLALLVRSADDEVSRLTLPRFANEPSNLRIESPRRIVNPGFITIGDDVSLGPGCLLNAIRRYPGAFMAGAPDVERQQFTPRISIGNRVSATGYLTVGAVQSVTIEDDALLASHIFIADNLHGMGRTDVPYKYQPLDRIAPVVIGRGSWIGEHVVVLPGVTIGEFAVVGANSVITQDVPARSVAVGAPARVIRRWSDDQGGWIDA